MAAGEGFEPSQTESESAVLPLHNPARCRYYYTRNSPFVKYFAAAEKICSCRVDPCPGVSFLFELRPDHYIWLPILELVQGWLDLSNLCAKKEADQIYLCSASIFPTILTRKLYCIREKLSTSFFLTRPFFCTQRLESPDQARFPGGLSFGVFPEDPAPFSRRSGRFHPVPPGSPASVPSRLSARMERSAGREGLSA